MTSQDNDNVLTRAELDSVIEQVVGDKQWKLIRTEVKRAADAMTGFLGEHLRMIVHVKVEGKDIQIPLFIKLISKDNESKAEFLNEGGFYVKESFIFKLFKEIAKPDPNPWCARTYLGNDKMLVMQDLAVDGYRLMPADKINDLQHALLAGVALARFHAAYANYATKRSLAQGRPYNILEEHGDIFKERVFIDNPVVQAAALLHKNFLNALSEKYNNIDIDFMPLYLKAAGTVRRYENTLNVLVHRDLWNNNIMFKYDNDKPTNALLVDFQIVQMAPPAFDPMLFLYMSVTQSFRKQHEETFLQNYFEAFMANVDENTKKILKDLKYDYSSFREWCEKARMFAIFGAIVICPFGLIEAKFAEKIFNDKDTFKEVFGSDRTKPCIAFAEKNSDYKKRVLEFFEEFVERYVVNK